MKIALGLSLAATSISPAQTTGAFMPVPRSVEWRAGRLPVRSGFAVAIAGYHDGRLDRAVRRMITRLRGRTGVAIPDVSHVGDSGTAPLTVIAGDGGQAVQGVDEIESYSLDVDTAGATLRARTVVGAIRGLETVLQLLAADSSGAFLPAVHIEDEPRFPWRGLNVDASRHFMPVPVIERTLDGMAAVKLNVLHWHLSDDQGFRVESRRFPRLQQMGSDSLFYTQDDIRHVVAYARDRGIRVVPEFDMPGHTQSWLVGYPQYSAGTGPYPIERRFGVFDPVFDPTKPALYTFLDRFIGEIAPLFPDAYFHVGGDEVNGVQWNANPAITAFKQRHGFANNEALQTYFNQRLLPILAKYHKRMIGWDEILTPDLPASAMIQSWRGAASLVAAAKQGHAGILSSGYYLDHQSSADYHYVQDPLPAGTDLTPEQQRLVLGGEACLWAEHVTPETEDSRIWPRLAAIAERLWSPREVQDIGDMYRRLRITSVRLEELGLGHEGHTARMLRRLAGAPVPALESFFGLVQPATFGQRSQLQHPDQLQPLTGAVDAARPDPPARWETEALVSRILSRPGGSEAVTQLEGLMLAWSFTASQVREAADSGAFAGFAGQVVPAAVALDSVARLGLRVLRWRRIGTPPQDSSVRVDSALQRLEQPQGLLRVWGATSVRRLLRGTP